MQAQPILNIGDTKEKAPVEERLELEVNMVRDDITVVIHFLPIAD